MPRSLMCAIFATLFFALPSSVWATPARVGLIRIENGPITLNGLAISTPQMVQQGGKLVLGKGARARLQLMGGNTEVTLSGPRTVIIDQVTLQKMARPVQRGNLASAPDIGNTTRGAAQTVRSTPKRKNGRGFRIHTRPTLNGKVWSFPIETTEAFFDKSHPARRAEWSISRLEIDGQHKLPSGRTVPTFKRHFVASGSSLGKDKSFTVAKPLIAPGQRYVLETQVYEDQVDPVYQYEEPFRLLSPDEKALLAEMERDANARAQKEGRVTPLLELASLYLEWDQMTDVSRVLKEAGQHPEWSNLEPQALKQVDQFQQILDAIHDTPVPVEDKDDNKETSNL